MTGRAGTLAERLGTTTHVSPLLFTVRRMMDRFPCRGAVSPGDWLLRLANGRGARIVVPTVGSDGPVCMPDVDEFSDEELVTALLLPHLEDRPQLLRLAAQLVSRGSVSVPRLLWLSKLERTERLLLALATSALRVDPGHAHWSEIHRKLAGLPPLRDVLLHWTRLAEPVPSPRGVAAGWRLVA